jgi:hypothetical protein
MQSARRSPGSAEPVLTSRGARTGYIHNGSPSPRDRSPCRRPSPGRVPPPSWLAISIHLPLGAGTIHCHSEGLKCRRKNRPGAAKCSALGCVSGWATRLTALITLLRVTVMDSPLAASTRETQLPPLRESVRSSAGECRRVPSTARHSAGSRRGRCAAARSLRVRRDRQNRPLGISRRWNTRRSLFAEARVGC